ncbi:glycosyltransferase [Halobacillus sp. B23F22_1]|uniref:glycosyltransferase n=1 Tax=Halobacillus sp. B23F22_1 TaxID=3459514 RepID=UPI00373E3914
MKLELLVSTMLQKDTSLVNKMNISTDAIIINQSNYYGYNEIHKENNRIRMLSFNERGVGKSRNSAIMRSDADVCVMADDDAVYEDDYEEKILDEFKQNPKADVIIFSVKIIDNNGEKFKKLKRNRVRFFNSFKYGAVRIAFKRDVILKKNIHFSLLFGGGTKYGSGEDSIFITDCLKKGLKIYTSPQKIANIYNHESSWFNGYNKKFFIDKGALFRAISPKFAKILILQFVIRRYFLFKNDMKLLEAYRYMIKGLKNYKEIN